jgi:hypothetical protein
MKTTRTTTVALGALTILLGLALAEDAEARIRVHATLRTPHVGVVYSNAPVAYRPLPLRPLPVRYYDRVKISKRDRRIAKRLAWYTGVPRRELIHAKRMGYSWLEIGRWLEVPRRVVKAARSSRSWDRFLDRQWERDRRHRNRGHLRSGDWYDD